MVLGERPAEQAGGRDALDRERMVVAAGDRRTSWQLPESELACDAQAALLELVRAGPELEPATASKAFEVDDSGDTAELATCLGVGHEVARASRSQAVSGGAGVP
jgi:hypothetical protein